VGYNPHPDPVVEWTEANCSLVVRGNHDKAVAGLESLDSFSDVAQVAARWTMQHIQPANHAYLRGLPRGPAASSLFDIWHGSLADEDEYITDAHDAAPSFGHFNLPLAFFGHTHLQGGFFSKHGRVGVIPSVRADEWEHNLELDPSGSYMINPGSVGQPRDGDPRAAYAIYDSDQKLVTFFRAAYPVKSTAAEIKLAGLPDILALRLFHGK
jgi:diadenosine tetraphosphatase ApaH/serine/threonine PP2A family protein phosphatase